MANVMVESFEGIHFDLSKQPGKCKFIQSGFAWKPSGGGESVPFDGANIAGAQWSRAARGYELKILCRDSGIIQLDGFDQEVSIFMDTTSDSRNQLY